MEKPTCCPTKFICTSDVQPSIHPTASIWPSIWPIIRLSIWPFVNRLSDRQQSVHPPISPVIQPSVYLDIDGCGIKVLWWLGSDQLCIRCWEWSKDRALRDINRMDAQSRQSEHIVTIIVCSFKNDWSHSSDRPTNPYDVLTVPENTHLLV